MTFLTTRFGDEDNQNSTTVPLAASGSYTGTSTDVENYGNVTVNITSDVDGGLEIQFSTDSTNWDIIDNYSYIASSGPLVVSTNVKARYFRIVYNNGSTIQTQLRLQSLLQKARTGGGSSGGSTEVTYGDTLVDAFGRLKVSDPSTLMDITHTKGKNELVVHEVIFGGATSVHDPDSSSVLMSVSSDGDRVVRQSRKKAVYQPGKSLFIILTGVINANSNGTDTVGRMGYYDDNDGIFVEYDGTDLAIVKRQNGTDTRVTQSSWNVDKADGTGNSGVTIDETKVQIFFLDIEWLGVGSVRVGMFYDGKPIILHKFHHANIETNTYMENANQPIRYELSANDTGSPSGAIRMICATVISDGGYNPIGKSFSASTRTTLHTVGNDAIEPIISIRLKTPGATGAEPKTTVNLQQFSISATSGSTDVNLAEIWLTQDNDGSALTSPSWVSANDQSAVEYDISSSALDTSNSVPIQSVFFSTRAELNSRSIDSIISLTSNTDTIGATGMSDIISLVMTNVSGGNLSAGGAMTWEEIF